MYYLLELTYCKFLLPLATSFQELKWHNFILAILNLLMSYGVLIMGGKCYMSK